MCLTAPITNISRGSLHDGPGIRTVVYFKGCGLRCKWCHNPETLSLKKQILYRQTMCIHCGKCVKLCPEHHKISGNEMIFLQKGCVGCGKCSEACPSGALELCGSEKTIADVFAEVKKDLHYYQTSSGGVTFSGGECLLHADFVAELAQKCKKNQINTAVESAFFVPYDNVKKVLPYIDLFFADLKLPNAKKHREFTGQSNETVIENITRLSAEHRNIILRIPVIPGVNDSYEDMCGFAGIIKTFDSGIRKIELLKYNNLSENKYIASGRKYTKFAEETQTNAEMSRLCGYLAEKCGTECYCV